MAERLLRQVKEERPEEETDLVATPSAGVVEITTVSHVDVENVEESSC